MLVAENFTLLLACVISVLMFLYSMWESELWQLFASATYSCHPGIPWAQIRLIEAQEFRSSRSGDSF